MPKEPIIPPYDPYDPRQNELLTIQPSLKQPVMQLEQVQAYLHNVEEVLTHSKEYIRIRGAMNTLEYITSYNYYCLNPL
ncbi:MAG TPA: hypothetical protein VFP93_04605, partial [Gammaproteobacteria bacterium]|nr:hypothetical protein [Gammaproteobacteria bacterium]